MFSRLGTAVARHAWATVGLWLIASAVLLALAVFGVGGQGLFDRLHSGEPRVHGSESEAANTLIDENRDTGEQLVLATSGIDLAENPDLPGVVGAFHTKALAVEGVAEVIDPFIFPEGLDDPHARGLVSTQGDGFLVQVDLEPDLTPADADSAHWEVVELLEQLPADLGGQGVVSSEPIMVQEVTDQIQKDLQRGEAIALPLSLLVMVIVFGGFLAAGMPIIGALASIVGGLGALWGFSYLLDLDAVVVNVVTILGLGLSIDYGLLIVSRYREELRGALAEPGQGRRRERRRERRRDPAVVSAVSRTMATAGRTVAFSAVTVAVSVAGLMLFDLEILRSLGAAGVSVVLIALISALTLTPAVLTLLGPRMAAPSALRKVPGLAGILARFGDTPPKRGAFSTIAGVMQRRPWLALGATLAILATLASPILGMNMRNSTTALLPSESEQQQFLHIVEESFPAATQPAITVVTEEGHAEGFSGEIARVDGVTATDPPEEIGSGWARIGVRIDSEDPGGELATDVVQALRELDGPQFWVTGQAANQIDFIEAILDGVWWAAGVVILATFVLLFLMTGSILVPLKALLINVVSLGASLGIATWIFGEGHLTGLLNFTSTGGLESYVVVVVVAFGFGLAMDYEVFLLARIKELHDEGFDNDTSVRSGLQLSGRIITSAALVIIIVFAGFIAGDMLAIKQVGVALAVTIAIDATLVRVILVPATMTLLGEWNWWAPRPLRILHDRLGIRG